MTKKVAIILVLLALGTFAGLWKFQTKHPKAVLPGTSEEVCLNNLRLIESGKMQWSLEQHKTFNQSPVWEEMRAYIGRGSNRIMPECPSHGVYTLGTVGEQPICSIHGTLPALK